MCSIELVVNELNTFESVAQTQLRYCVLVWQTVKTSEAVRCMAMAYACVVSVCAICVTVETSGERADAAWFESYVRCDFLIFDFV